MSHSTYAHAHACMHTIVCRSMPSPHRCTFACTHTHRFVWRNAVLLILLAVAQLLSLTSPPPTHPPALPYYSIFLLYFISSTCLFQGEPSPSRILHFTSNPLLTPLINLTPPLWILFLTERSRGIHLLYFYRPYTFYQVLRNCQLARCLCWTSSSLALQVTCNDALLGH